MSIEWLQLCVKSKKLSLLVLLISLYLHVRNVSLKNDYFYGVRNKDIATILTVTEEPDISSMRTLQPKSRYKRESLRAYLSHHKRKKSVKSFNENRKTKSNKNKNDIPLRKVNNKLRNTAKPQKFQGFETPNIMADYNNIVNDDIAASQNFKNPFPSDEKDNNRNRHSVIKTSYRRNSYAPSAKRKNVSSTKVQFKSKSYRQLLQKPANEENLQSECITIGLDLTDGNRRKGKNCVFPFIYNGKSHNECTWDQAAPESPWCSTKIDDKGVHVEGLDEWGVCGDGCPIERQIYYCGFWHCEVDKNGTMGEYEDIKSDCKSCEATCSKDPDCDVVECDYFDSRPCIWRKRVGKQDQGCGKGERMVYSEQYKTCVKPEQARKKSKESKSLDERNNGDSMVKSKDASSKFSRAKGQSQFNSANSAKTKTQSNADENDSKREHLNTSENKESRIKDETKSLEGSSKSSSNKINTLRNSDEVSQRFQENEEGKYSRVGKAEDQNILKDREKITPETNRLTIDNRLRNKNNQFKAADELRIENSMPKDDIEVNSGEISNNREKKQEKNYSAMREGASENKGEANVDDNTRRNQNEDEQRSESAFSNRLQNDGEERNFIGKRPSQHIVQENARVPSSKMNQNLGYDKSSNSNSDINQVNVDDNVRRNQNEDEKRSESALSKGLQNHGEERSFIGKRPPQNTVQENTQIPSSKMSQNLGYEKSSNANLKIDQVNVDDNIRRNQQEDEQSSESAFSNGLQNDGEERNFIGKRPPPDIVQENAKIPSSKMSQNLGYEKSSNANSEIDQVSVDDNKGRNQNEDEQRSESAFSNGLQNDGEERNFIGKRQPQDIVQENTLGPSSKMSQNLGEFLNSQQQSQEEKYSKRNNGPSRNIVQETTMLPSEINDIRGFNKGKNVVSKTEPSDEFRIRNGISNEGIQLTSSEFSNNIQDNEQEKYSGGSKGTIKDIARQTARGPSSKLSQNPPNDMRRNDNTKPKHMDKNRKRNRISDDEMMLNPRASPKSPEKQENQSRRSKELTQNGIRETAKLPSSTMRKNQVDDKGTYEDTDLETYDIQLNPREFPNNEQGEEEDNFSKRYKGTTREIVRKTTKVPSRMNRNQGYNKVSEDDVELEPTDELKIKNRVSNDDILLTPRTSSNGMQEQGNEKFTRRNKESIRDVVKETTITPSKKSKGSDQGVNRATVSEPMNDIGRNNSLSDDDKLPSRAQVLDNDHRKRENYPRGGKESTKYIVQKPTTDTLGRNKNRIGNNQNIDDKKPKTENESIMNKNRIPNDAISTNGGGTSNNRENIEEKTLARDNHQQGDRGQKTSKVNSRMDNDRYGNKRNEINKQPLDENRDNNGDTKSKIPPDFERNNPLSNDNVVPNNFEVSNGQQEKEIEKHPTIDEGSIQNIAKATERVPSEPSKVSKKFDDNEGGNANTEQTTDDELVVMNRRSNDNAAQKRRDFPYDQQKKQEVKYSRDNIGSTENLVQNTANDTISLDDIEIDNADDSKMTDSDTNLDESLKNDKPPKLSEPTIRIRTSPHGRQALHHTKAMYGDAVTTMWCADNKDIEGRNGCNDDKVCLENGRDQCDMDPSCFGVSWYSRNNTQNEVRLKLCLTKDMEPKTDGWRTMMKLKDLGPNGVKNDESLEHTSARQDEGGHTSTYDGKRKVVNVNDIDIDVDGLLDGLLDGYDGLLKRDQDEEKNVTAILTRLGLDKFIENFKDNHIDYEGFRRLTMDDMDALKLPLVARRKIRSELSRIKSEEIKEKDSHKKSLLKHDPIDVNIELHLNMNRKTDSNIKEMVSLLVDCMMECCKNHQVPAGCLDKNNEMIDPHNDMHEIINIVKRDSCSKYHKIYDECTKSCKELQNMSRFKVKRRKTNEYN